MKYFLPKGLLERTHFHGADLDLQKFSQDFIPKTHLPSDLGGDLESVETLNSKSYKRLMTLQSYFEAEEKLIFDVTAVSHSNEGGDDEQNEETTK